MRGIDLKGKSTPPFSSTWWDSSHAWTTEEAPMLATGRGLPGHLLHFPNLLQQDSIKGLHSGWSRRALQIKRP